MAKDPVRFVRWKIPWQGFEGAVTRWHIGYCPTGNTQKDLQILAHEAAHVLSSSGHDSPWFWAAYDLLSEALGVAEEDKFAPWRSMDYYREARTAIEALDILPWVHAIRAEINREEDE